MMERICGSGQGRMSQGAVEIFLNYDLGMLWKNHSGIRNQHRRQYGASGAMDFLVIDKEGEACTRRFP
jgi:hypothetical protein